MKTPQEALDALDEYIADLIEFRTSVRSHPANEVPVKKDLLLSLLDAKLDELGEGRLLV